MSFKASEISVGAFKDALARYPAAAPDKLKPLDTQRYDTIPKTLMERKGQGDAYLEKEEVEKLVEWKLKHGTFRPKLLQLVQSNPSDLIKKTSRKAFSTLQEDTSSSLKVLTSLKGIGPATASLLLSAADPDRVPFFSDELFRWVMWNEAGSPGGWKRIIKYNVKEYAVIVESVGKIVERLGVRAVECEKVAWVLGHEQKDIGKGFSVEVKKGSVEDKGKEAQEEEQKADEKKVKRGVKRKGEGAGQAPSEGIRRSIRRKFGT